MPSAFVVADVAVVQAVLPELLLAEGGFEWSCSFPHGGSELFRPIPMFETVATSELLHNLDRVFVPFFGATRDAHVFP